MKKIIGILSTLSIAFALVFTSTAGSVSAATLDEIKKEINELKEKQNSIDSRQNKVEGNKNETDSKINQNQSEQQQINQQIKELDQQVADTNNKIRKKNEQISNTEKEITKTEQEIEQLEKDIADLKERIEKREALLKDRLRNLQENGGDVSYLEVLMGAKNFGDFLDRATAVTKIMDQDKNIMETHIREKKELEEKKKEVEQKKKDLEEKKQNLENQKAELTALKEKLDAQRQLKNKLMKELEQEEQELKEKKLELEEQQEILSSQKAAIQAEMNRAESDKQQRKEQLAAQRRAEERAAERRRQAQQNSQSSSSSSNGSSSGSSSAPSTPAPSGSGFISPANGPLTSGYGSRWGSTHFGIDIGKYGGSTPIKAAASGTVIKSYYSSSYGNVVYLSHSVNGQIYTTVYAHLQNREVSDGQTVSQGQRLGYMGSTGQSTGPHLHFELHKGPWNYSKSNAVNPASYINF
ncbi:peptidoglycan DD-metalloendopeptidase family protein [Pontibacillus yanchengensis]|uniref:Peptidoglycan DD-metalloendopeptidase family protein n=1 Tax=Pontibacillus yanchengensis TaxID=462910 RepID=A0A6I5A3V3_9BACI|nr:M23 family metallopeptidase [Pontibacillus yanchengensis]MYL33989.1 peptidoglycan DD-metalloendopeptidase family protein [Pontibacillus yanchengensis]